MFYFKSNRSTVHKGSNPVPGYDLITVCVLKELPRRAVLLIKYGFNVILLLGH